MCVCVYRYIYRYISKSFTKKETDAGKELDLSPIKFFTAVKLLFTISLFYKSGK